jgi:hypothetical protein
MSGIKNVVTGFLGAILVALALQVITPPNLVLTSKVNPNSLTNPIVWNTRFELLTIALGFVVGALLGNLQLRKTPKAEPLREVTTADPRLDRECPHCKEQMRRDAGVCPHCRRESPAWTLNGGTWWLEGQGQWYWLDDTRGIWVRWEQEQAAPPPPTAAEHEMTIKPTPSI